MDIKQLLIDEKMEVLEAMRYLEQTSRKILFIVQEGKLVASLTDGDIRRWILKQGDLNKEVRHIANYSPKYLEESQKTKAKEYMKSQGVEVLPIVDSAMHVVSLIFHDDLEITIQKMKLDIPVVIMAGGMGTRLYPYTKILPKPLIPVGEIPISEHIINQFYNFGCRDFYLIVNHKKNMIKAYFNEIEKDYNIYYVEEERPLGTGGGISLLKDKIDSTFILSNCDILIDSDFTKIFKFHKEQKNVVTMVASLKNYTIPYGVVDIGKSGEINAMREKPVVSFFVNTGCYIAEPEIIQAVEVNKAISFPKLIEENQNKGKKIGVYPIGENAWLDMGQMDELLHMKKKVEADG